MTGQPRFAFDPPKQSNPKTKSTTLKHLRYVWTCEERESPDLDQELHQLTSEDGPVCDRRSFSRLKTASQRRNTASNVFVKGLDLSIDTKALHDTFSTGAAYKQERLARAPARAAARAGGGVSRVTVQSMPGVWKRQVNQYRASSCVCFV